MKSWEERREDFVAERVAVAASDARVEFDAANPRDEDDGASEVVEETYLIVAYDVSRLTERERLGLLGEATIQGELSEEHPSVEVADAEVSAVGRFSSTAALRFGPVAAGGTPTTVVVAVLREEVES